MKIALITAVFGETDAPKHIKAQDIDFDAFYFTDKPRHVPGPWLAMADEYHPQLCTNSALAAKYYKAQSHRIPCLSGYDVHIWVDGSVVIKACDTVGKMVDYLKNGDIAQFKHPKGDSITGEVRRSAGLKKYAGQPVAKQADHYLKSGMPDKYGLWVNTYVCRRITDKTCAMFDAWWKEIFAWSIKDQVSLPFVYWKHGFKPVEIPGHYYFNGLFAKKNHNKHYQDMCKR